jgi:hypothetical protein
VLSRANAAATPATRGARRLASQGAYACADASVRCVDAQLHRRRVGARQHARQRRRQSDHRRAAARACRCPTGRIITSARTAPSSGEASRSTNLPTCHRSVRRDTLAGTSVGSSDRCAARRRVALAGLHRPRPIHAGS